MSYPGSYSFRLCNFSKQLAPCFSERRPFSKADSKTWAVPPARSRDVEQSSGRTGSSLVTSTGKMGVGRSKRTWHLCTSKWEASCLKSWGKEWYGSIVLATITRNYWIAQIQMSHMFPWSGRFNLRLAADSQHLNSSSTSLTFQQVWFMGSYRLAIWNPLAFGNQSAKKTAFPGKSQSQASWNDLSWRSPTSPTSGILFNESTLT